jgi:hypothetical protein
MLSSTLICMQSTSVHTDRTTHEEPKQPAAEIGATVGETVAFAVRRLRQERIGEDLCAALTSIETSCLDAELG